VTISLVLPAYNEAEDLPPLLKRIGQALHGRAAYRIVIVDDGSQDGTADVVREAARHLPITLIQHPRNMGLGAAMRTGLEAAAEGEGVVVTMDADNSHDPELIHALVARVHEGYDVVIASRFQPGGRELGVPFHRRLLSRTASFTLRLMIRYPGVRDYTCGYRAYRVEALRRLIHTYGDGFLRENGFSCMLELLLNLRPLEVPVSEVALVLRYDLKTGSSKMRIARTVWRYAVIITRAFLPMQWRHVAGSVRHA
jgi:dolichol-phosphate mannosyltransferase